MNTTSNAVVTTTSSNATDLSFLRKLNQSSYVTIGRVTADAVAIADDQVELAEIITRCLSAKAYSLSAQAISAVISVASAEWEDMALARKAYAERSQANNVWLAKRRLYRWVVWGMESWLFEGHFDLLSVTDLQEVRTWLSENAKTSEQLVEWTDRLETLINK